MFLQGQDCRVIRLRNVEFLRLLQETRGHLGWQLSNLTHSSNGTNVYSFQNSRHLGGRLRKIEVHMLHGQIL